MRLRHGNLIAAWVAAGSLWGCGDSGAETMQPGIGQPGATAGAPAAMTPTMPPMTSTPPSQTPTAMPPQTAQPMPMQPMAAPSNGTAGSPSMMPQMPAPMMPMEPAGERPGDTCQDRRVSYAKPCHTDPDPCNIKSGWKGDEYCLKPPPEGEGVQIHIGPKDYKNMAEVMKYVIQPGAEFDNSVLGNIPLTEEKWWNRITVQMRPGSHHWISRVVSGKPEERFYDDTGCGGATAVGSLGGGQNLIYDNPPGGKPAPENEGLGRSVAGNASLCMNLHSYNFTDEPQIREIWINLYFVDEAKVTQRGAGIGVVGGLGLNLPPGMKKELSYTETFTGDGRIIQLFGHRHVWTPRFAVWHNETLIYDSWDWQESVTFNYDSLTMNPPINTPAKTDGAVSGTVNFKAGDTLKFTCFIENDSDITLRFANQLMGGEMCNLWGTAVGTGLSGTRF